MTYFLKNNVYLKVFNLSFSKKLKEYAACEMKSTMEKIKARKKRKRKWKRDIGILLYTTAFIAIIILSAVYQRNSQSPPSVPKKHANEYFVFSDAIALADPLDANNFSINVKQVGFNMTAIGGNVTGLSVTPYQAKVPEEESWPLEGVPTSYIQNQTIEVSPIIYPEMGNGLNLVIHKSGDKWGPLVFVVKCYEAYGVVSINVSRFISLS